MASIFDGNSLSFNVTTPTAATVTSNTSKSNAKAGKLGSDGHYFEIVLASETFTAASINGFINTNDKSKNWAFQFSTDKGASWSAEVTQANDGNKTAHDIAVEVTIPAGANGFRVVRRAGTSTQVNSITLTLGGGSTPPTPETPTVTSVTVSPATATLDINGVQQLTATVVASPDDADKTVTWTSSAPSVATVSSTGLVTAVAQGTATITATSNLDNTKSGTCTVTVNAPATEILVTAISIKSATTIQVGASETLSITYTPADANTGKAVNWTSSNNNIATVDNSGKVTGVAAGSATITATSTTDNNITASCAVTVQAVAVTGVSIYPTSANLQLGGSTDLTATVLPANATDKSVSWTSSNTGVATVNNNGHVSAVAAGTATITVTTTDGNKTATCSVTVTAGPPVPQTSLTTHVPEIYEAKDIAGGYNTPLVVVGGREYEVFYINRDNSSNLTVATSNADKAGNICDDSGTSNTARTKDGWLTIKCNGTGGDTNAGARDEFQGSIRSAKFNSSSHVMEMHIQGYDQFSFYGNDNNQDASKNKMFEIYIDDVKQTRTPQAYAINRFDITSGEHVIRISAIGGSDSKLCSFSLRVSQEPRTKYIKGNDSAQVVMQTQAIKPVVYATKYNNIPGAETRLVWTGAEATGITLTKTSGTLSDTLTLSGVANCPIGTYNYAVVAYYNGQETNRLTGSFSVKSDIKALTDNLNVTVFNTEAMEQIKFRYYALSANDVQLTWGANGQPSGISGNGNNGTYTIGGTPTVSGTLPQTFPYEITVAGADTVYKGAITVKELVHTDKDVLFLYENTGADNTPIYNFLKEKGWNPVERKALSQLRPADQYGYYKWILISEDVNANNPEVLAIARGEVGLPVLNMKSFSYGPDRLDWGEPDNGTLDSVTNNRYNIIVQRADHPIFQKLGWQQGAKKQILSNIDRKGLMPVNVDYDGTLCLATAYTRSLLDYYKDGELQTFLHEVPASMRNGKKYLCLPIAYASCQYLTNEGKNLLKAAIDYLTSNEATVALPELEITRFAIGNVVGEINQMSNTILVAINEEEHPDWDLAALKPSITLKDPTLTHVSPASGEEENFASSISFPVEYIVSDYINRRIYNVTVRTYSPQGIDEVYTDGEWVNVFDIYGRLIATTNENIYTMSLPRGMYLIVTSGGKTIKLMK